MRMHVNEKPRPVVRGQGSPCGPVQHVAYHWSIPSWWGPIPVQLHSGNSLTFILREMG